MGKVVRRPAPAAIQHRLRPRARPRVTARRCAKATAISINGSTGEVFSGAIKTADSELKQVLIAKTMKPADSEVFQYYDFIMKLADKHRRLGVRTNADTPEQVRHAIAFGAEGIGLCRTEHMFFEGDRIDAMREMILADDARRAPRGRSPSCCPTSGTTSSGIFKALDGCPATIRFLDPPLHEFLPALTTEAQARSARKLGVSAGQGAGTACTRCTSSTRCSATAAAASASRYPGDLRDAGPRRSSRRPPMCRRTASRPKPGDHDPAGRPQEGARQPGGRSCTRSPRRCSRRRRQKIKYMVGTMIEIPRACPARPTRSPKRAEFFSFGTNDLTQTCLGMSPRRHAGSVPAARTPTSGIFKANPVRVDRPARAWASW